MAPCPIPPAGATPIKVKPTTDRTIIKVADHIKEESAIQNLLIKMVANIQHALAQGDFIRFSTLVGDRFSQSCLLFRRL